MKVGALFAGIGGIELGFLNCGFKIDWAIDKDKYACQTYAFNFPDTTIYEEDVRKINFVELKPVDIITAGFPCQPFSVCGKQKGFQDKRGNSFFEIMRAVDIIKPKVIFIENVANLTEHEHGRTFNIIHNEIAVRDYCIRYRVVDACNYGIPQHRTRIYLIAFKSEKACDAFKFPEPCKKEAHIFDFIDKHKRCSPELLYYNAQTPQYKKLKFVIDDDNQIYRFSDYGIQKSANGISFTLKANMGTWYNRIPVIKDDFGIRNITPEECLRLQGFPQSYCFPNIPTKEKYKQAGNTVPVPIITGIADNINIALNQKDTPLYR